MSEGVAQAQALGLSVVAGGSWAPQITDGRSPEVLHCVTYGHEWEPRHEEHYYMAHWVSESGEDWIERLGLVCAHCGEERWGRWTTKTFSYFFKPPKKSLMQHVDEESARHQPASPTEPVPLVVADGEPRRSWWWRALFA